MQAEEIVTDSHRLLRLSSTCDLVSTIRMYVAFLRAVQRRVAKSTASESTFCVTRHFPNKHDENQRSERGPRLGCAHGAAEEGIYSTSQLPCFRLDELFAGVLGFQC